MIDIKQPFHLTLINVAFAKLEQISRNSIANFFSPRKTPKYEQCLEQDVKQAEDSHRNHPVDSNSSSLENLVKSQAREISTEMNVSAISEVNESFTIRQKQSSGKVSVVSTSNQRAKTGLHRWLQKQRGNDERVNVGSQSIGKVNQTQGVINKRRGETEHNDTDKKRLKGDEMTGEVSCEFDDLIPDNIDRNVFLQLPLDIQREILENSNGNFMKGQGNRSHSSHQNKESLQCDHADISSSKSQSFSTSESVQSTSFFTKMDTGKSSRKSMISKPFFSKVKSVDPSSCITDKNMNLTPKTCSAISTCASPGQQKQLVDNSKVPPHIDKTVFETLPEEIQMELIEEWRRKQSSSATRFTTISIKNPAPSSENNIMSYFPKANK